MYIIYQVFYDRMSRRTFRHTDSVTSWMSVENVEDGLSRFLPILSLFVIIQPPALQHQSYILYMHYLYRTTLYFTGVQIWIYGTIYLLCRNNVVIIRSIAVILHYNVRSFKYTALAQNCTYCTYCTYFVIKY